MHLKYVILFVTSLCVAFIVVVEVFQSHLDTPTFISSEKVHLIASKPVMKNSDNDGASFVNERTKDIHESVISLLKGDYYYDDVDPVKTSGDFVVPHQTHNIVQNKEHKVDTTHNENSRDDWKTWKVKVRSKATEGYKSTYGVDSPEDSLQEDLRQYWIMKNKINNMSEEERLNLSPYIYHEEKELEKLRIPVIENGFKYITFFLESNKDGHHLFSQCRYKKCATTPDTSRADLVAFSASSIRDHNIFTFSRPPGQRWLMYTIDPSIKKGYNFGNDTVKSLFNATMTYNLDADIPLLFGRLRRVFARQLAYFGSVYEAKTKTAAWFVSHCNTLSKREVYIKRMQSLMDVDVYGRCGNLTCGGGEYLRSQDDSVCLPMLTRDYKFYLAFENSFCLDYITEKFFKLLQGVQVIPVVRGGFDYKRYLPSGTYINADDFKTPEELAQYLVDLGNDKQRYIEMLKKKDEWRLLRMPSRECLLCEYLHSNPPDKFYPNLKDKFGRNSCWFPNIK